ncbi:hypothetical protein [Arenicella xantha]|nr:hypothetical protein [Arenicella xantha]
MKRILWLISLLLLNCDISFAQHYTADTIFSFPGNKVYAGGFAKVNDDLFITYKDGHEGKGVYAQSRTSGNSELILANNSFFGTDRIWDSYFHSLKNGALIDIFGKLYFTDGTRAGTRFIADFGYTGIGGSLGYDFSRILQVVQAGRFVYLFQSRFLEYGESTDQEEPALWRIDLRNLSRTKIYQDEGSEYRQTKILDSDDNGETVIVFADRGDAGTGLWLASPNRNDIEPLALFDNAEGRFLRVSQWQWSVRNRAGLFFCRKGIDQGEGSDGMVKDSVWRLSNSNTLARIAENCGDYDDAAVSSDKEMLYFTLNDGREIWQNSGPTTSNRLLKLVPAGNGAFSDLCTAGNYLVANYIDYNDWEVINGQYQFEYRVDIFSRDGSQQSLPNVEARCIGDKVLLAGPDSRGLMAYEYDYVFTPEDSQRTKIYGTSSGEGLLTYQQFSDDVLFLYRRQVSDTGLFENRYRDRLVSLAFNVGNYTAFLPSVMHLLEEQDDSE